MIRVDIHNAARRDFNSFGAIIIICFSFLFCHFTEIKVFEIEKFVFFILKITESGLIFVLLNCF